MPSNLLNTAEISAETYIQLANKLKFVRMISRQFEDRFGREGFQIGDKFDVRMPSRYVVQNGPAIIDPQYIRETSKQLELTYDRTLPVVWTQKERTLSLQMFSENYIQPMVTQFANDIELTILADVCRQVHNYKGTIGARPNDSQIF